MAKTPSKLTQDQLDTLRALLLAARRRALGASHGVPDVGERDVGDEMDAATTGAEAEDSAARTDRDAGRVEEIDHALAKLERGEYGVSEESGDPIGFARLKAIPWARL